VPWTQLFQKLANENRTVEIAFHVHSLTKVIREVPDGLALAFLESLRVPKLSVGLATHEHNSFPAAGELTMEAGDGDASLCIHLNFECVAIEIAERPLEFSLLTRCCFKFGDKLLIFDLRIKTEVLFSRSERLGEIEFVAKRGSVARGDDGPRFVVEIVVVASEQELR